MALTGEGVAQPERSLAHSFIYLAVNAGTPACLPGITDNSVGSAPPVRGGGHLPHNFSRCPFQSPCLLQAQPTCTNSRKPPWSHQCFLECSVIQRSSKCHQGPKHRHHLGPVRNGNSRPIPGLPGYLTVLKTGPASFLFSLALQVLDTQFGSEHFTGYKLLNKAK